MSDTFEPTDGYRRPNLSPRRGLFWTAVGVFTVWVALLAWLYVSQILMKRV